MTSKMSFGVRQVRDFLHLHGCVLTVRGYDYSSASAVVPELDNIRIKRTKVCEIKTIDNLVGFVPLSGFKTASEWWTRIRQFCRGRMYLYRVQIDDTHISKMEQDYEKIEQQRLKNIFRVADREFAETHPLDIRGIDTDPTLVNLQSFKDAAHADRLQREARATQQKHERMRRQQDFGGNKTQTQHVAEARSGLKFAREATEAHAEELTHDIAEETDIDEKLRLIYNLTDVQEQFGGL